MSVMVNATRSPLGDTWGSETRRTFSRSSIVNLRSWAKPKTASASKDNETAKNRFIEPLELFRFVWESEHIIAFLGDVCDCHGIHRRPFRLKSRRWLIHLTRFTSAR